MPLLKRAATSPRAQGLIRHAFRDLESVVSAAHSKEFASTTLENVEEAALEIENQLAARQSMRNMRRLMPLFSGLGHYSKVIEVLCNGTPYLPWLWAPIKFILKVASDFVEAFDQIIKAYSSIAESLKRFKILEEAFYSKPEFQETMAVFYVDILTFHKVAYLFLKRSSWKNLFQSSWGRFQRRFDHILENLRKHEDQIDKEANAHDIAEARDMRDKLEAWRTESLDRLAQDEKAKTTTQLQAIVTWLRADDSDQLLILDAISSEGARHPGTCSWILKHKMLRSWLRHDPDLELLWLQGSPGTGKSIIAGQLLGFLRTSQQTNVISHFCTYSYDTSTQYEEILKSLLLQIIQKDDDITAHVYEEYVAAKKPASIPLLEQLLATVAITLVEGMTQGQALHIIIDGLDEVDSNKGRKVVRLLESITKDSIARGAVCKVLIISRPTPVLETALRRRSVLRMSEEKENSMTAIKLYSQQRLDAESSIFAQLGLRAGDLMDLSNKISLKADGMFLWARLVLDYLVSNILLTRHEVFSAVDTLPRKLSEFYERLVTQMIAKFDSRSMDRMKTILGWIAFAKRPLHKTELRSALMYGVDSFPSELVPSFIFDMCKPLVEERRNSSFVFIHVSVKEYLQDSSSTVCITPEDTARAHGRSICACFLSGLDILEPSFPRPQRLSRVAKSLHAFHSYAHEFWVDHLCDAMVIPVLDQDLTLKKLVQELSNKLGIISRTTLSVEELPDNSRIEVMKGYEALHTSARISLHEKLPVKTRTQLEDDEPAVSMINLRRLRDVLTNYQMTVREVLQMQDIDGVTHEELRDFKQEFGLLAFPCRLRSCPDSITGFLDHASRLQHEATHTQRLQCRFTGCQYPPFNSTKALRTHEANEHRKSYGNSSLRRHKVVAAGKSGIANPSSAKTKLSLSDYTGNRKAAAASRQTPYPNLKRDNNSLMNPKPALSFEMAAGSPIVTDDTRAALVAESFIQNRNSDEPYIPRMYPPEQMHLIISFLPQERRAVPTRTLDTLWRQFGNAPEGSSEKLAVEQKIIDFNYGVIRMAWEQNEQQKVTRVTQLHQGGKDTGIPTSYWSVSEMNDFPALLKLYGTDWAQIAAHMQNKTGIMVKNYFQQSLAKEGDLKRQRREKRAESS